MQDQADGGVEGRRGRRFETYALEYYLLLRLHKYPLEEAIFESQEDATFIYLMTDGNGTRPVKELLQCKKIESRDSSERHGGVKAGDYFAPDQLDFFTLRGWVERGRSGYSAASYLAGNPDAYYTALVFAGIGNSVRGFELRTESSTFEDPFPVTAKHRDDPMKKNIYRDDPEKENKHKLVEGDVRYRVRVVRLLSPDELQIQCRLLLEQIYGVSDNKVRAVDQELRRQIEACQSATSENNRHLRARDINAIIASGKVEAVRWESAHKFLSIGDSDDQ